MRNSLTLCFLLIFNQEKTKSTGVKGHSVLAKAAYNARDKLRDDYYGKTHDYSKKDDLIFSKIFLPEHIPKEFSNREYL